MKKLTDLLFKSKNTILNAQTKTTQHSVGGGGC